MDDLAGEWDGWQRYEQASCARTSLSGSWTHIHGNDGIQFRNRRKWHIYCHAPMIKMPWTTMWPALLACCGNTPTSYFTSISPWSISTGEESNRRYYHCYDTHPRQQDLDIQHLSLNGVRSRKQQLWSRMHYLSTENVGEYRARRHLS